MHSLSVLLSKYFVRNLHKIVFCNGMTLSGLSEEMWERLGYSEIDASVVSRVINGKRSFTPKQIHIFCEVLKLSKENEEELLNSISQTYKPIIISTNHLSASDYLEFVEVGMNSIPFLRQEGSNSIARSLVSQYEALLKIRLKTSGTSEETRVITQTLSRLTMEQSRNITDVILHNQASIQLAPTLKQLCRLAEQLDDKDSYARLYLSKADAYYNHKKYYLSTKYFHLAAINTTDPFWKLEALRAYAIGLARTGERALFQKTVNEIENLIQDGKFTDKSFLITVYEGLCRGAAYLHEERSFDFLEKAKIICAQEEVENKHVILPKIQLIRTSLVAISHLPNTLNFDSTQKIAQSGIDLSKFYQYNRQEEEINELMNQIIRK